MSRVTVIAAFCVYLASLAPALLAQGPAPRRTVWDGVFTAAQADRGRTLYAGSCAQCHGGALEGGEGTALRGETFWMDWGERTVGEFLAYVSKNMPFSEDGSAAGTLSPATYADIIAHILDANGFPAGTGELTQASGAGVAIIRKDGPGELPATTLAHVVGCLGPRAADGSWRLTKASRPVRVSAEAKPDRNAPLGDREYALKFVLTNLTKFVGHRMSVTGLLLGAGGIDGLNVSSVESVAGACQ